MCKTSAEGIARLIEEISDDNYAISDYDVIFDDHEDVVCPPNIVKNHVKQANFEVDFKTYIKFVCYNHFLV